MGSWESSVSLLLSWQSGPGLGSDATSLLPEETAVIDYWSRLWEGEKC